MDTHYTPRSLAKELVGAVIDVQPSVVADLCAGHGELLLQAESQWPDAEFAAVDVDPTAIRYMRRLRPDWSVGRCDIFNPLSRRSSHVLRKIRHRISLLLLNPPFSCRGNARFKVDTETGPIFASTAMSALVVSLSYIEPQGSSVIVLPLGAMYNQKDRLAWEYIRTRFDLSILDCPKKGVFPKSSANIVLVRLSPHDKTLLTTPRSITAVSYVDQVNVRVIRGCLPHSRAVDRRVGPVVVHSTDLRDAKVYLDGQRSPVVRRCFSGPAVLLPRVGRVVEGKIAILPPAMPVVLTDCVIGLTTTSIEDAYEVRRRLVTDFEMLRGQYVGTGAPFVTMGRLQEILNKKGITVNVDV